MKLGDFHNPDNLTPEQIGVAEGWRLLRENEIVQEGDEFWTDHPLFTWQRVYGDAGNMQKDFSYAHRTDRPDLVDESSTPAIPIATTVVAFSRDDLIDAVREYRSTRGDADLEHYGLLMDFVLLTWNKRTGHL